jgi:hypothetical protein
MTTCADVTDCLLFRHLALFLGGVGFIWTLTVLRLIGMTKCAREIKISEKYLAFFKETV